MPCLQIGMNRHLIRWGLMAMSDQDYKLPDVDEAWGWRRAMRTSQ